MATEHVITGEVVGAYCMCPRKAYLLLHGEHGAPPHEFVVAVETRAATALHTYLEVRRAAGDEIRSHDEGRVDPADITTDVVLRTMNCEARIDAVLRIRGRQQNHTDRVEPLLVVGTRVVGRGDKLRLAFVSHVLATTLRSPQDTGVILNDMGQISRFRLQKLNVELRVVLHTIRNWLTAPASPPPIILNDHCRICPFRGMCLDQARKKDDLSLLQRMTPKVMQKYHKKGIFTLPYSS